MKRTLRLLIVPALFLFAPAIGQEIQKPVINIVSAKQSGQTVAFTVHSNKEFYVGGNVYILHIGNRQFAHSEQSVSEDGKGVLSFLIPATDYAQLADGAKAYVTYGQLLEEEDSNAYATLSTQTNVRCWYVGDFSKKLLK
jgi:hypothetical protein